ncbi:MAG: hypothetical protein PHH58_10605 [Rhodoferax sp.]|nr:hypothetical protein [Rhodoferax sp.]
MSDKKDRKFWWTLAKLVLWAVVLLVLIGLGLYYTAKFNTYQPPGSQNSIDWGISRDSPLRNRR